MNWSYGGPCPATVSSSFSLHYDLQDIPEWNWNWENYLAIIGPLLLCYVIRRGGSY